MTVAVILQSHDHHDLTLFTWQELAIVQRKEKKRRKKISAVKRHNGLATAQ